MAIPALVTPATPASVFDIGKRLVGLLEQAEQECGDGRLPDTVRGRLADALEALRVRLAPSKERNPRSLFDIDERLVDLMDQVEEAVAGGGEVPEKLAQEINLELFRMKIDRPDCRVNLDLSQRSLRAQPEYIFPTLRLVFPFEHIGSVNKWN
jgi:hypothetical protein